MNGRRARLLPGSIRSGEGEEEKRREKKRIEKEK